MAALPRGPGLHLGLAADLCTLRMECIGSIDQGTQSTRFFLYDRDGRPLAHSQVEVPQIYPKSG